MKIYTFGKRCTIVCHFFNFQVLHLLQKVEDKLLNTAKPHCIFVFLLFTAQFAGEDPVVALEAALQFEDTRESMQAFCVGQYMEVPTISIHVL